MKIEQSPCKGDCSMKTKLYYSILAWGLMTTAQASSNDFEKACDELEAHNSAAVSYIIDAQGEQRPIGVYQHYKGNFYNVLGIVRHTETEESLVLYQSMYPNFETWVRPLPMFFEEIVYNGIKQARFKFIRAFPRIR